MSKPTKLRRLICRLIGHNWTGWFWPRGEQVRYCKRCAKEERR